ncbi:MAG TPA: glycoside hydrolase N-terminal domain-containing protein [Niabella sp.]|nr:glycoside hydrolase N-terminal domain-containing protein [Niabella sp.]HOZ97508.1 glycoside hydrolase N-terminal domain-containing protein [Niabella sp.]HQW15596.1 glycoside hydrolase N-terminal domain-containing protein [Niabella sp.]HQX20739.1 glycoside hydrolase N-terminal domain-containing protein [Niabella sp.]HQX42815.1 glycoside hydrolase N-terminal domain-containing protein [Niabella sp.]
MNFRRVYNLFPLFLFAFSISAIAQPSMIWYNQPATNWESERLPIGNGRMGAMLMSDLQFDTIQFNEQSLWSGDNNWDGEYETGDHGFGSYRNFGEVRLAFLHAANAQQYKRTLDINNAIYSSSFTVGRTSYFREAFASHPDQVMVFRYSAKGKGVLTGSVVLQSAQNAMTKAEGNALYFDGVMPNQLKHAAKLLVVHEGGKVMAKENFLEFENCSTITLYLDARTNYKPDYDAGWRGQDPLPLINKELKAAVGKGYSTLRAAHINDFTKFSLAAKIDIGKTPDAIRQLPTDIRIKKYATGGNDPDLEETLFQYGRYLLISSSRPNGLPANLQGLWNNSNKPAWASDYHNNINIQMNYWLSETTNLSACQIPLIDYIVAQSEPCRIATRKAFGSNTRGWTARTSQSIFGGNGWEWNIPASAWYAQHVYEHWAFTQDKNYLSKTAYPILKEICQFWEDRLKKLPDGSLVVPDGWSPEHGPREDGVMHDQQIVWDLFANYLDAAKALNIDKEYQLKVAEMQKQLAPNKIGKWGQLQEWQTDRDDPNDQHRHTSHLFAVYPGRQISITQTPELAKAAIISLRSRSGNYGKSIDKPFTVASTVGDSRRSWTWPWRCALWARLGEGEKAGIMIRGLISYNLLPNMFTTHPPFQIDGNLGIAGAIAEMLLQSHAGEISLLPAIPESWKKGGSFQGLKARGGFTVDCSWKNGKITTYKIYSQRSKKAKVRINGKQMEINSIQFVK